MKRALILAAVVMAAPAVAQGGPGAPTAQVSSASYRLSGAAALRPSRIWDDGYFTYIQWPETAELPAVFSRGSDGREVIAEGMMMGEAYVLDRVHDNLIFRIDSQVAAARRGTFKK